MKGLWLYLLVFFLSIFFSSFLPINLVVLVVVSVSVIREPKEGMFACFLTGMVFDLIIGRSLGATSAVFLIISLLINLYKRKFSVSNFFYLILFSYAGLFFFDFVRGDFRSTLTFFLTPIFVIIIYPLTLFLDNYFSIPSQEKLGI